MIVVLYTHCDTYYVIHGIQIGIHNVMLHMVHNKVDTIGAVGYTSYTW